MYKMMTAQEVIEKLFELPPDNRGLNFTFNDIDKYPEERVEGWYGIKIIKIFDEYCDILAIGYWGGPGTVTYDIESLMGNVYTEARVRVFCTEKLQEFMNDWCDGEQCEKICIEIEE